MSSFYDEDDEEGPIDFRTKEEKYFDELEQINKLSAEEWFNQLDDGDPF